MPPKELLKDLFNGDGNLIVSALDSSKHSTIEKLDLSSTFKLEPSRDAIEDNEYVDYPYKIDFPKHKNKGRDILLAISNFNGKMVIPPVRAIIDTEFVTDDSSNLMRVLLKFKVNGREMRESIKKIVWAYKHPKPRKTTYKTIRHDCAKRNGRR